MSTQTINFTNCDDRTIFNQELYRTDDGDQIAYSDAKRLKDDFESAHMNEKVLAFHFGIDELRTMIQKADNYNATVVDADLKVVGFDFYRCNSNRIFPKPAGGNYQVTNELDLVVFPTTPEYLLHEIVAGATVPILSHSRPCPKLCP